MQNEEELRNILAGLQEQQRPIPIWQRIAEAVARGLGTAASDRPGEMLLEQVREKGAERQAKEQRERDIQRIGVQFQLQDLANRLAEGREISKEGRTEQAKIREEERAEDRAEADFYRQLGGQIQLRNIDQRDKKELFNLDLLGRKQLAIMDQVANENLTKQRADLDVRNQQKATEFQTIFNLTLSGAMTGEEAGQLLRKIKADDPDDPLTAKERRLLQKARRALENEETMNKIRVAVANNQGGAGDKFEQQLLQGMLVGARTSEEGLFRDEAGNVKLLPITRGIGGIIQQPEGMTFVREATIAEKTQKILDDYKQIFPVLKSGKIGGTDQGAQGASVDWFLGQLKDNTNKLGYEQAKKDLLDFAAKNPSIKDAVNIAIGKYELEKAPANVDKAKAKVSEVEQAFRREQEKSPIVETKAKSEARARLITEQAQKTRLNQVKKQVADLEKAVEKAKIQIERFGDRSMLGSSPTQRKAALEDAQKRLEHARNVLANVEKELK